MIDPALVTSPVVTNLLPDELSTDIGLSLFPSNTDILDIMSYTNPSINLIECQQSLVTNIIIDTNSNPLTITVPATTAQSIYFQLNA